jgi:hypothetical protein
LHWDHAAYWEWQQIKICFFLCATVGEAPNFFWCIQIIPFRQGNTLQNSA